MLPAKIPSADRRQAVAVWCPERRMARVATYRGRSLRSMGYVLGGQVWLAAEEALFLVECGQIIVMSHSKCTEPLTVRTLYYSVVDCTCKPNVSHSLRFPLPRVPVECYWVYAHLRRLGFVVFRAYAHQTGRNALGLNAPSVGGIWNGPSFEVHEPDARLSSRAMAKPSFYVVVSTYAGSLPTIPNLVEAVQACKTIPVKIAVVSGDGTVLIFDVDDKLVC